ncbi:MULTISPECIES: hypothetical protein [Rhizobium]|uniref:hypothetical protein n=1 Tax=Rhizobium TaxID=379 RepID=UPI000A8E28A6|nr:MULTISPECIES: hypothetical protein [Rhizobium]
MIPVAISRMPTSGWQRHRQAPTGPANFASLVGPKRPMGAFILAHLKTLLPRLTDTDRAAILQINQVLANG